MMSKEEKRAAIRASKKKPETITITKIVADQVSNDTIKQYEGAHNALVAERDDLLCEIDEVEELLGESVKKVKSLEKELKKLKKASKEA